MKKFLTFMMAVVLVMSSLSIITVHAEDLYDVWYYGDGCTKNMPWIAPTEDGEITFIGGTDPVATYSMSNTVDMNRNMVNITSTMEYSGWYKSKTDISDKYSLYVDIDCTINYINSPIPVTGHARYMPGSTPVTNTYSVYYSEHQFVSTIYIYHNINNRANINTNYTSFTRTQIFLFW